MATALLIFPLLLVSAMAQEDFKPICNENFEVIRHPEDCSVFYQCSWKQPSKNKCENGSVYSKKVAVCVWPGTDDDDCDAAPEGRTGDNAIDETTSAPLTVEERCEKEPSAVFPNPDECHQFYNCSKTWTDYGYFPAYKDECPYPQLFDTRTLRCDDYRNVQCGDRKERNDACDYDSNKCPRSHCIPCQYRFSNCTGLPDGRAVFQARMWSPWFGLCQDERSVGSGQCERDQDLGITQFFSPDQNKCVSLYEIPRDKGGYYLNCTGLPDGFHPDDATNRANLYFRCENQQLQLIALCPEGQVYGDLNTACVGTFAPIQPV